MLVHVDDVLCEVVHDVVELLRQFKKGGQTSSNSYQIKLSHLNDSD